MSGVYKGRQWLGVEPAFELFRPEAWHFVLLHPIAHLTTPPSRQPGKQNKRKLWSFQLTAWWQVEFAVSKKKNI